MHLACNSNIWPHFLMQAHAGGDAVFADNLFRFGNQDGAGTQALLQHPLAVLATSDGNVWIADSYNHSLKASAQIACSSVLKHDVTL